MLRIGSVIATLAIMLLAACGSEPPEPDAQARAACAYWEQHVDRLFAPDILTSERQELAEGFAALANGSQTQGFSEAATTIADSLALVPEASQSDFDDAVDHVSQVCNVPRPDGSEQQR
jgi:hypothetical protein